MRGAAAVLSPVFDVPVGSISRRCTSPRTTGKLDILALRIWAFAEVAARSVGLPDNDALCYHPRV